MKRTPRVARRLACAATLACAGALATAPPAALAQALTPADAANRCVQPAAERDWLARCVAVNVTGSLPEARRLARPCADAVASDRERCLRDRIAAFVAAHPTGTTPVQITTPSPRPLPGAATPVAASAIATAPATPAGEAAAPATADIRPPLIAAVVSALALGFLGGYLVKR